MPQGGRTINPTKPRIFLVDLEYAKKEEWERRRKLRLKQVRQQARDIASVIRNQAIKARKRNEIVNKCQQLNAELISEGGRKTELENELSECLTSVGTAHSSATVLTEVDELVRHRTELQDTLARVRAELAAEKIKETRKPRAEVVDDPREGICISKVNSGKPTVQPAIKKYFPALVSSSSHNVPATPPNLVSVKKPGESAGSRESVVSQPAAEKTILSPPAASYAKSAVRNEKHLEDTYPDGRKSCPPATEVVEVDGISSDSDSGQTWPPASVRKKKSFKVRMYDHSARKCTEYVQQCGVLRMDTPEEINMKELIREEEVMLSKKTNEELENRRIELQRGVRALREEVAKQDWDSTIGKLCQFAKEKRIKKSLTYHDADREEPRIGGKDSRKDATVAPDLGQGDFKEDADQHIDSIKDSEEPAALDTGQGDEADSSKKHRPPVKVPSASLSSIISKFNKQRQAILHDQSVTAESCETESEDENSQLPLWLQTEVEAQNSTVREGHGGQADRVGTPETMMENLNERKRQGASSSLSSSGSNENGESLRNSSPKGSKKKHVAFQSDASSGQASSSRQETSTSSGDINVEIRFSKGASSSPSKHKVSEESKPVSPKSSLDKKSSMTSPNKDSSSTSYYSPPEKLSPQQLSLLSDILSRMSVKNRNPVLHHYINRVLEMSRHSLSDLDVSSSSELSIRSDLFKKSQSTPLRPVLPRARNLRFNEDISSTAVSVSSVPRDSVGDVSSSDNATEIAGLLRNILELQRLYRSATSSDPLSDSASSYRSVPDKIGTDRCDDVALEIGPVANFSEETGIFESQEKTDGQPPMFYTIFDKDKPKIDIPRELFPKPVFAAADRQPATENFDRRFDDVPDGYAMRPEHDPISLQLPKPGTPKVITSLSDIESEVSSIQSTPTKILSRRSPSPASIAASDDKDSVVSGISSSDFISSAELRNNDLIGSTSNSTSDFEDVFQSLGLGWALSTLRRIRNARNLPADDSSSKTTTDVTSALTTSSSDSKNGPSYRHSTPVKPKDCPRPIMESSENDAVPSLTPPNLTLLCPTLQK